MKSIAKSIFLATIVFCSQNIFAQQFINSIDTLFNTNTEIIFKFTVANKNEINKLSRIISIDNVKGDTVIAYANKKEFKMFLNENIPFQIISKEIDVDLNILSSLNGKNITAWDFYPTYNVYDSLMQSFQNNYPSLCRVFSIKTLSSGRKILFAKISANSDSTESEPKILLTSSIHGDELTGYILMLRLIDYLLTNYNINNRIKNILDNTEIWINPLANPDGTYKSGNNTVAGAVRYNANNIDLNRNFPDPQAGQHPDGNQWQPETIAFMALADSVKFTLGFNIHGGAEVCNYPWDTWAKLHPDDNWWNYVCREYADTVHANSVSGYLDDLNNGITNGYAWYQVTGGRQDYMNYFGSCREFCLEISNTKKPAASTLPNYWNYNYRSFLNYIEQGMYGINGTITDSLTGFPLKAKVFIQGHDTDSSHIYSVLPKGYYHRPIFAGNYNVTFSADGYYPKTLIVNVQNKTTLTQNVKLIPIGNNVSENINYEEFDLFPNPFINTLKIKLISNKVEEKIKKVSISNISGKVLLEKNFTDNIFEINTDDFPKGIYFIKIECETILYTVKKIIKI